MSKAYTVEDFSRQINEDRTWRIKEISDLRSAIERADSALQKVLLRALITICYAHWEGYVKYAATSYMRYVSIRKIKFSDLNKQFLFNHFIPRLTHGDGRKLSIEERCQVLEEFLTAPDKRFSKVHPDLLYTGSNLKYDILKDICLVCNVPTRYFKEQENFIDKILLKRRNEIAHGEDTRIHISELETISGQTIALMRQFGDELENIAYSESYRSAKLSVPTMPHPPTTPT